MFNKEKQNPEPAKQNPEPAKQNPEPAKQNPEPAVYQATGSVNDLYIAQVVKSSEPNNENDTH